MMKTRLLVRSISLGLIFIFAVTAAVITDGEMAISSDQDKFPAVVSIRTSEKKYEQVTYCDSLIAAIDEAGIAVGESDLLSLPDDTPLKPGEHYDVTLTRLGQVTLNFNGYAVDASGSFASMADLLSRSGYADLDLSDGSRIEKGLENSESGSENLILNYVNVDKKIITRYQAIPFSTITVDDDTLYIGQTKVRTEGLEGQRALIYEETYENGILITSVLTGTEVNKAPLQKVILKGTRKRVVYAPISYRTLYNVVMRSFSKINAWLNPNGSRDYKSFKDNGNGTITVDGKTFKFTSMKKRTITMYDGLDCCMQGGCHTPAINHRTFSGIPAQRGLVATYGFKDDGRYVSSVLPMGTVLFIEGYGLGVVADIHGVKNNPDLIDVCYNAGEIRAGIATLGKIYSRVYVLSIP